jgi:hypothetical protein
MSASTELLSAISDAASAAGAAHLSMRLHLSGWRPSENGVNCQNIPWYPDITDDIKNAHHGLVIQERRLWDLHDLIKGSQ